MMKKLVIAIAMLIPSFGAGYSAFAAAPAHEQHIQVNKNDKELLARLVSAEAKGEPYAGKVAVATVVLNRVDSSKFPDTVKGVIYQKGQYSPVSNGQINKPADKGSKKAVEEAINFQGQGKGSLFFFNPDKTGDQWLRQKQETIKIGQHVFAK
ncbi:cell wall hydrolase [Priestia aryabhattai]|uniref:cell wall hydrolase n=1 Tax=Priestia TaxID=2800373 RepID=UPI002E24450F|nr:cell wall hydrolase [Priestia megaterium]MED3878111.1 cell wall hydrolase [Priestia megaterium]